MDDTTRSIYTYFNATQVNINERIANPKHFSNIQADINRDNKHLIERTRLLKESKDPLDIATQNFILSNIKFLKQYTIDKHLLEENDLIDVDILSVTYNNSFISNIDIRINYLNQIINNNKISDTDTNDKIKNANIILKFIEESRNIDLNVITTLIFTITTYIDSLTKEITSLSTPLSFDQKTVLFLKEYLDSLYKVQVDFKNVNKCYNDTDSINEGNITEKLPTIIAYQEKYEVSKTTP